MFEIKNVSKGYGGEFALRGVTMSIGRGLNFIVGASGSGKTTLLKIISGMESDFQGDVSYNGQSIKTLNEKEKSYLYNNVFGFVWQDFNLLDELTVTENITLPLYLKDVPNKNSVKKVLQELKISELANQKVGTLSGGQKQRVAIARELIKDPQVIIADEPTSALDEASSRTITDILREISKSRMVIIVTHDTSLIDTKSKVYELDKGELIAYPQGVKDNSAVKGKTLPHKLSMGNAFVLAVTGTKSKFARLTITMLSLLVAATLLLVTLSGSISKSGDEAFNKLYNTYGQSILDIDIVKSFMSAAGTDGGTKDEPNANVDQNIKGLYDKYLKDERVTHIAFSQAFNDINITVDGKDYAVKSSGSVPTVNEFTAGNMPMGSGNEVVVPNSFVKSLGLSDKEAIGKKISFKGAMYNWESGEPVLMPVSTEATIVGVIDTLAKYDVGDGTVGEYSVDDSFFFSKTALMAMRGQAKVDPDGASFTIRTKSPADLIAIKDELNALGIVPLGRFELVEDLVRLSTQTSEQSGVAVTVIGILSIVVIIAVSLITALMRKREFAIFKVSGYGKGHLALTTSCEFTLTALFSSVLFLALSPLINMATTSFWGVNILNGTLLGAGVLLVIAMGIISCIITACVSSATKASASLKTGDR